MESSVRHFLLWPLLGALVLAGDGCGSARMKPADAGRDGDGNIVEEPDAAMADGQDGPGDDAGDAASESGACDPTSLQDLDRGNLNLGDSLTAVTLERCSEHRYSFAAAQGSKVQIGLRALGVRLLVAAITYPDDPTWEHKIEFLSAMGGEPARTLEFSPDRSGEFFLLVRSLDPESGDGYDLGYRCLSGCDLETTRFPIVMVHGWTGFKNIGPIDYFYGIPDLLTGKGYPVFVVTLDPYNSTEVRSVQLAQQVDQALTSLRARKVDFVAHSQGGLDSRRVISTLGYGDRTSALVTIATPHQGTPIADVALGYLPGVAQDALDFLLNLLGATGGNQSDAKASFESITEKYVQNEFNPQNPDDRRVSYSSWAGSCCPLGIGCANACHVEITWAWFIIDPLAGDNDGMVPVLSAPWGDFRGVLTADHFDEVGQLFGLTNPTFDHQAFYLGAARDLAAGGH